MIARVVAWYARRIVNVNINIVLAGVLALVPVLFVVRLAEHFMATQKLRNGALQETLETHHHFIISGVTFLSDIIFDVAIYFLLHWLANHAPRKALLQKVEQRIEGVADAAAENVPFFKDAAKVQLQRAVLSPLLYFLWLGAQFFFMNAWEWPVVWATIVGFCIAIGTVRTLHTFWMLREERRARARAFAAGLPTCERATEHPARAESRERLATRANGSPGAKTPAATRSPDSPTQ